MAIKRIRDIPNLNVLDAAIIRIKNVFSNGVPVILSMSGGKDSIVLCSLVYDLIEKREIDPSQLTVEFIDEEAMFDCVIEIVKKWRKRFLAVGAKFNWYCIQVRHFNCLNSLSEDESFICWDTEKRDVWVREMPKFAITSHPKLRPREDNYQKFMLRKNRDSLSIIGLRGPESIQRQKNMNYCTNKKTSTNGQFYPIHDWKDGDVFKYIRDNGLEIPEVYQLMWQSGTPKNRMRISQFFSIDTAKVLSNLYEFYPDLADRVNRREPNAYLVQLYWDTEMFRRSSKTRRKNEESENRDYRQEVFEMFKQPEKYWHTDHERKIATNYRRLIARNAEHINGNIWRNIHSALLAGDPKHRTYRAICQYIIEEKKTMGGYSE